MAIIIGDNDELEDATPLAGLDGYRVKCGALLIKIAVSKYGHLTSIK